MAGNEKDERRLRRGLGTAAFAGFLGVIVTVLIAGVTTARGTNEFGQRVDCGTVIDPISNNCDALSHRANIATWLLGVSIGMCIIGGVGWFLTRSGHVRRLIPLAILAIAIGFGAAWKFHAISDSLMRNYGE